MSIFGPDRDSELQQLILTVVVITRNNDCELSRTLNSLEKLAQSTLAYEIIIVDGGSGEMSMTDSRILKNEKIVVVKESDTGIFNAMNKGYKYSRGKWLNYLNSGDVFDPAIDGSLLNTELQQSTEAWAVGRAKVCKGGVLQNWKIPTDESLRFRLALNSFPHQATFYHTEQVRSILGLTIFEDDNPVADWSLTYKLLVLGLPRYLDLNISINEIPGFSSQIPLLTWSRRVVGTRASIGRLLTGSTTLDFLLQILVGLLSRLKNKLH